MRKIIILLAVFGIAFLVWAIDFLIALYQKDKDDFWIVLSLTGITLLIFICSMWMDAINSEDDDCNSGGDSGK